MMEEIIKTLLPNALAVDLNIPIPCRTGNIAIPCQAGVVTSVSSPVEYVNTIYEYSLMIVGALAFLIAVYAGIRYVISAGNPARQQDAKDSVVQAAIGLLFLLGGYLLLKTISPTLVELVNPELETPGAVRRGGGSGGGIGQRVLTDTDVDALYDAADKSPEGLKALYEQLRNRDFASIGYVIKNKLTPQQRLDLYNAFDSSGKRGYISNFIWQGARTQMQDLINSLNYDEQIRMYNIMGAYTPHRDAVVQTFSAQTLTRFYDSFYSLPERLSLQANLLRQITPAQIQVMYNNFPEDRRGYFRDQVEDLGIEGVSFD